MSDIFNGHQFKLLYMVSVDLTFLKGRYVTSGCHSHIFLMASFPKYFKDAQHNSVNAKFNRQSAREDIFHEDPTSQLFADTYCAIS